MITGITAHSSAQPQLTETNLAMSGDEAGIAFQKYQLPNGLTIILLEDHSIPRVVVDVIYRVGSAQDPEGKSGMAHFFEHLMFKGSKHVPDGEHSRLLAEVGGSANAQTFEDRTMFTNTAPGNALQRILWLEADRMGSWLTSFNSAAFEAQRKVILNERMQNTDNSPSAEVDELTDMLYYPAGYPYRRPVGGFADDIQCIGFEDAVSFYQKYYVPSNAIVCIGGNFRTVQALKWISQYFGPIPGGSRPASNIAAIPPSTRNDTLLTVEDPLVNHPFITIKFPTVKKFDKDFASLECLGHLLGGSQTAYLNSSIQQEIPGCTVFAFNYSLQFGGDFSIVVNLPAGASVRGAKDAIFRSLRAFGDLPDNELEKQIGRFRKWVDFQRRFGTQSIEGRIFYLVQYETILGKADFFSKELAAYEQLTVATVRATFHQYIGTGFGMIALAEHDTAEADLKHFYSRRRSLRTTSGGPPPSIGLDIATQMSTKIAPPDSFDRSPYPPLDTARFIFYGGSGRWSRQFPNGINAIGAVDKTTPVVSIDVYWKNPGISAADLTELAYILQICPSKHFNSSELTGIISDCGAYYFCAVDHNSIILQIKCLRKYFDTALEWLQEKLLYPVVTDSVYKLARSKIHNGEVAKSRDIIDLATSAFRSLGPDPADELPDTSIVHSTARLSNEKAAAILGSLRPRDLEMVCYGPIEPDDLMAKCHLFSSLTNGGSSPPRIPLKSETAAPGIYCFDVPGASQVAIRCGFDLHSTRFPEMDLYRFSFANFIFGGFFNSRLNSDLREKKGYTYRAYSYIRSNPGYTSWSIELSVPVADLSKALPEIIRLADSFSQRGLSPAEMEFLKSAFAFSNPLLNQFYYDKMKFLMLVGAGEMREDIDQMEHALMDTLTTNQLNEVVLRLVDPTKFRIVLAGDGRSMTKSLQELVTPTDNNKVSLSKYEFPVFIR
jgi:zinc protease